jgi:hypothetical protein
MASSEILRRAAFVRTDVSEERSASINVVPSSPFVVTLMMEAISSSETSVLTRATRCNIPEYGILHSYRGKNLIYYLALTG